MTKSFLNSGHTEILGIFVLKLTVTLIEFNLETSRCKLFEMQ